MSRCRNFVTLYAMVAFMAAPLAACDGSGAQGDLGVWTPGGAPSIQSMPGPEATPGIDGSIFGGSSAGVASTTGSAAGNESSPSSISSSEPSSPADAASGSSNGAATSSGAAPAPALYAWDGGTGTVPCDVAALLTAQCTSCHSDPPINSSLSGLVTFADLVARSKEDPTKNEAQLSVARMQNATSPMPPASLMMRSTAADIAVLQGWIDAGYPSGKCALDAGAGDAALAIGGANVFAGQAAFALGTESNGHHNPGQNCLSHHHNGEFSICGTVFDAQGNGLAGAEVRVVDTSGMAHVMYSGSNGNFYLKGGTTLALGGHAGARNASATALMISAPSAACNSCHATGGVTTRIHLP